MYQPFGKNSTCGDFMMQKYFTGRGAHEDVCYTAVRSGETGNNLSVQHQGTGRGGHSVNNAVLCGRKNMVDV